MKNICYGLIMMTLICFTGMSCFGKTTTNNGEANEIKYNDLKIFDLHGPVKSVSTNSRIIDGSDYISNDFTFGFGMEKHTFNFNKNGLWREHNATISLGIPISFVVKRNQKGEIIRLVKDNGYPVFSFTFTWQDGRIASMKYKFDGDAEGTDESFTRYIYKDGKVAAMDCQLQYCEGDCETTDAVATVEKEILDVHGNWIKRTLHVKGTKKSDYDYVEHISNNTHYINVTIIQTRDITYWD